MATPTSRAEFKKYVLRKLGHPAIKVNVTDEQLDDRVDEAVSYYVQRHYGGSERVYLAHQLTQPEVDAKKIVLDDTIIGVVGVFPIGFSSGGNAGTLDGMAWQIMLSDVILGAGGASSGTSGVANYVIMRTDLNVIAEFMVGQFPVRYNERTDELFLDVAPSKLAAGNYVIIEAHRKNDPETYPDVWSDHWLQRYAAALVMEQWGQNLSKFAGAQLPGGVDPGRMSADLTERARREIEALEREIVDTWSPISIDFMG